MSLFWTELFVVLLYQDVVDGDQAKCSERAVKTVQDVINQTLSEEKLQKILFIKNSIQKPTSRTKEAYKAASEQLTPEERLAIAFDVEELSEVEISYDSDDDSDLSFNLNLVDDTSVLAEIDSEIVNFD